LIIVSRRPEVFFDAQLWADDGFFFDDAICYGWQSLVIPYNGYIHFLPRIITNLAIQLSEVFGQGIAWAPLIMNFCTVALSSFCAVGICSSKFHWMGNIYFRLVLISFILLFPNAQEIWGNVTNLHWWFGILEFFLIWHMLQNRKMPNWGDTLLLSAVVLTSPNGLLVLPAIAWAYFLEGKYKPDNNLLKIILIFTLTLVQLYLLLDVRTPKNMDIALLFNNTIHYVFYQQFGNLLLGQVTNSLMLAITGAFLLLVVVLFSRKLFKNLYIPFVFLCSIVVLTVLGADVQMNKYGRYIFVPTVVIFSILMYEGREQWRNRKKHLFSITKIVLFALFFLLISVRVARNYSVEPLEKHPWKTQAALFDREGKIFYHFSINPICWSVAISSSVNREDYIPTSSTKIIVDNSHIIQMQNIKQNDSLFTVVGPSPQIIYQLPETATIAYCSLDLRLSSGYKKGRIHFLSEKEEIFMIFYIRGKNLITMNESMLKTPVKQVCLSFPEMFPNDSFVIEQIIFYTVGVKTQSDGLSVFKPNTNKRLSWS
jgi:hypothetical protein